jgi:thiol-disulfide isomerase/thioredoxin
MKQRLIAFGVGLLVLIIVFAFAVLSSGDLRLIYISSAVLLLGFAIWLGARGRTDWLAIVLLPLPLFAGFSFVLLREVPALWPGLLLWAVATAIGFIVVKAARPQRSVAIMAMAAALVIGSLWYCVSYLPKVLARELNHFRDSSAPAFTLQPISEGSVPITSTPGKVLLIDFFATWCAPCKAELPELEAVRDELKGNGDIQFVLVDTNAGGDTPERFRSFAQKRNVTLPLAFDPDGKARNSFGSTGFPSIVVIDRVGRVRLTRAGYNPAEANFRRDLVRFLKTL